MTSDITKNEESMTREEALSVRIPLKEAVFGDRDFYRRVLVIVLPIILQTTLTNVVSLLDNIMVGRIGTLQMSSVAIVNQLIFVFYLCIFGALSGAGIYGTQYFGKGDYEGVRGTVRLKILIAMAIAAGALLILGLRGPQLIGHYIPEGTGAEEAALTMHYARQYLSIMMIGLVPFAATQVYAGTHRESGRTVLPMAAGMIAMAVNFVFNLLLIFGYLGFPRLGVVGAAIATVMSRFVELAIVAVRSHTNKERYGYYTGLYSQFRIPRAIVRPVLSKTLPLFANEMLWSLGEAVMLQCYSVWGLGVIAAINICNTIAQVFNTVFMSLGNAAGIMTGQELGAGRLVSARRTGWRMVAVSFFSSVVIGLILAALAPFIPRVYKTEADVRHLATVFLIISGLVMPIRALSNSEYFILRSGGKTLITMIFDSFYSWLVFVPSAYLLSRYSGLPVHIVYLLVQLTEIGKSLIGFILIKKGTWVKNLVSGR